MGQLCPVTAVHEFTHFMKLSHSLLAPVQGEAGSPEPGLQSITASAPQQCPLPGVDAMPWSHEMSPRGTVVEGFTGLYGLILQLLCIYTHFNMTS